MTVFVTVVDLESIVIENRTSLDERGIGKGNSPTAFQKGAEDVEKTLDSCSDDNIVSTAQNISPFPDIVGQNLTQILFPLRLAIRKKTVILAQCTFYITPPQIEPKAFPVHTGGCEVIAIGKVLAGGVRNRGMLSGSNVCYIIAALSSGDDVAVCCKLKIGAFDGSAAEFQFLGTFAQRRHFASGRQLLSGDQFPVIMINFQI